MFCLSRIPVVAQAGTDFLKYDRILAYGYNEKHELVSIDTSFSVRSVVTIRKSKAYIRDLYTIHSQTEKVVKWDIEKYGNYVKLKHRDKIRTGVVVNDSTLNWRLCCSDTIEFFMVPISKGIQSNPFREQLILQGQDRNAKFILTEFERGLQKTSTFYQLDSFAFVYDGTTRYTNSKYNYLTSLAGWNEFLQVKKLVLDSIIVATYYTVSLKKGERLKGETRLLKRVLPDAKTIKEVRDYLTGTWTTIGGRIFDDSTNQWRRLNECNYIFGFSGDSLYVTRKFLDNSSHVETDRTTWKVSSSGDFIVIEGRSNLSNSNIVIDRRGEGMVTFSFQDCWTTNRKRRKKVSIVLETEKINRR